ncbi:MAG: HAMP domain-containing histidine kinase [Armatimonadetes bacterium]|nr:HAMP domain-containing histidine kinase [Anaerolineae bacterium]
MPPRLWVQLSLAFSAVVMTVFVLVILISVIITRPEVTLAFVTNDYQTPGGLLDRLITYYQTNQTWRGVGAVLTPYNDLLRQGPPESGGLILTLTDMDGVLHYDGLTSQINSLPVPMPTEEAVALSLKVEAVGRLPLVVEGFDRGQLLINRVLSTPFENFQPFLVRQLSNLLLRFAILVGIVGVVAGVLVSRSLTGPLNELERVARAFGAGDRQRRARLAGGQEVREVARAFNEMADSLDHADTLRRNLVADVAHELRTPLTVLQANLQAILDGVYPLTTGEIESLMTQTELLRRLVSDLHELAQAEARQLPMERRPLALNTLIAQVGEEFKTMAAAHGVQLRCVPDPAAPIVSADSNRLTQVLNNLLHNALTHTPSGGMITLAVSVTGRGVATLRVQDNGSGIPPDALERIFERFYRVDEARSRAKGGAGLGLAIVQAIVALHDGQISVHSDGVPGRGTTFSITLPTLDKSSSH